MPTPKQNRVRTHRTRPQDHKDQTDLFTRYEVQMNNLFGGWQNTWTTDDERGNDIPLTFSTPDEAEEEIESFMKDIDDAVKQGDMDKNEKYDPSDFRIVKVRTASRKGDNMRISMSKAQWEQIGKTAGWDESTPNPAEYTYHINLNERGSFFADVRDASGKTVFAIKAGNESGYGPPPPNPDYIPWDPFQKPHEEEMPDESSIFEDGFMKSIHDMKGLKEYLVQLGIMKENQTLRDMQPMER
jgi:hypothetical protein